MKLPIRLSRYQGTFNLIEKAFTENQNLIYGISMTSGIVVAWATYASRRHHQKNLEQKLTVVSQKYDELELNARQKVIYRLTIPACVVCSLIGYGIGRGYGSYRSYKFYDNYKNTLYKQISQQMKTLQTQNNFNIVNMNQYLSQTLEITDDKLNVENASNVSNKDSKQSKVV